jgi:hypothetical protein
MAAGIDLVSSEAMDEDVSPILQQLKTSIARVIDESGEKRQLAWTESRDYGDKAWSNWEQMPCIKRQVILDQFLKVLRECADRPIKLAVIDWLEDKIEDIAKCADPRLYMNLANELEEIRLDASDRLELLKQDVARAQKNLNEYVEWEDIRQRAEFNQKRLWDALVEPELGRQEAILKDKSAKENDRTTAIYLLADRNTLGSRDGLRILVENWVSWIPRGEEPRLVEYIAERIRYNRFAVLALIEHFGKPGQLEKEAETTPPPAKTYKQHVIDRVLENQEDESLLDEQVLEQVEAFLASPAATGVEIDRKLYERVDASRLAIEKQKVLLANRRIARQLADMSDPAFFEEGGRKKSAERVQILAALKKHAVPVLMPRLSAEGEDPEIRQHIVRLLGYTSGREAVNAIARQLVSGEKRRKARQDLLDVYYLEPSQRRSEEAAEILDQTIKISKRTLRIQHYLNIAVFWLGLFIVALGLWISINNALRANSTGAASGAAGLVIAFGGFAAMLTRLIRDPLDRIQNAMANLVHVETAFTSFIWKLHLNGTYIQSVYVRHGKLEDAEIGETAQRIENAMGTTMYQVSMYTEKSEPRLLTRLNRIEPAAGEPDGMVTVHGQYLLGADSQKKNLQGMVMIDHRPVKLEKLDWKENTVRFMLPGSQNGQDQVMVSLFVDGMETNALPYHVLKNTG